MAAEPTLPEQPPWYREAVIYQAHVKSFYDSNGDGIGDFAGLTKKLDYLADLGVTALWILPFYPSPLKDDGYDIADYRAVNPAYGSLDDFRAFLAEAHRRGIRVITELVMNHTSDQHPWFQRSRRAAPGTPERDFYVWSDTTERYKEARVIFKDFEVSNWTWDPLAKAYFWHRFYSHQPDLNFENPLVEQAMLDILDFWMDLGVDGLRLDAVPYLFEADHTNCENLPATHAILRRISAHIKARHGADRMLLAEANQWPEDAVAYFGKGDECQMAFHFPLMPRIFMALRMEERFPIVDILEQTPEIPGNCQWALFLRNHDELTLEMVTDEERDYMYRVYARDKEARINLGIRRRLSPLVDNDRRKVELLHVLLFSLPGTPVIYYGDEIGMGDNIFLGDRNGVRTPMQWSPDRNAGFSVTNPQRLYLPVISDPEYHYESLNVENQERNLSSLLWWMRRRLALRQRFTAFGAGTVEFLHPDNPKVLCVLRRHGDQILLVAVNLSVSPQVTSLDLPAFNGFSVEEISSLSKFPPITAGPYPLMMAPYGYYWLLLKPALEPLQPERERTLQMNPANWIDVLQGRGKELLEREVLPAYLPRCRWFGGKSRNIAGVDIQDRVLPPEGGEWALAFLRVEYVEGASENYLLPLARADGEAAAALRAEAPDAILTELDGAREGKSPAILYEAMHNPGFRTRMMGMIASGSAWPGLAGVLRGRPKLDAFKDRMPDAADESRVLKAEQSNSSIIFPGRHFVKFLRRLEEGENPELEILRFFDESTTFRNVPPYVGALEYASGAKATYTIAIAEGLVGHEQDAWSYALTLAGEYMGRLLESRDSLGALPPMASGFRSRPALPRGESGKPLLSAHTTPLGLLEDGLALEFAHLLGKRTAEMHLALASRPDLPAFAPEHFSRLYQRSLYQSMRNQVARVYERLSKAMSRLPPGTADLGRKIQENRPKVMSAFGGLLDRLIPTVKIRVHGDYHLGQVLYTGKDVVILDFEGEPARSMSERKLKRSPWKDVAGMLRSFHYAIHSAWPRSVALREEERKALEPWVELWPERMTAGFLEAYLEAAGNAPFVPAERDWEALLRAHLMEKAVYELGYELNNRPDWAHIPMAGILKLI
ncbi:MAG TPA: maltose alpha-D-glucosyltransferase [Fibrobacteria bacterium]|nr:maltose alpha-D-glucosyltransferase [Fibrobacteria bacterium]